MGTHPFQASHRKSSVHPPSSQVSHAPRSSSSRTRPSCHQSFQTLTLPILNCHTSHTYPSAHSLTSP
uniref:Uncharacterized protein n=1 Tax=Arundo donax TaxID=35708 RepID=A0A0A9A896_ARUDO